ncbi:hypothetical protein [Yoonia sp. SDW83-1]|uniref:hypothetical protein n=1 Tax=Yoonia sp. SDW83-1 TaxID=3366945 RepID=UPI00398C482F
MTRVVETPLRISAPRIGERPSWWSEIVGIRCPNCDRPQSPRKMYATNPYRAHNRTDYHLCGGCGQLLYLTGEHRVRRYFTVTLPSFFGVALACFYVLRNVNGLNIYREGREAYEPNFWGFLIAGAAIFFVVSLLSRFEIVGQITSSERNKTKI